MQKPLSNSQKKHLKGIGHHLSPVVIIGQGGLTDAVSAELARAVFDHELIKIKIPSDDKSARLALLEKACASCGATLVANLGRTALLYLKNPNPNEKLSNLHRYG